MRYVKEGWPIRTDSKDVLHYKMLEDSLAVDMWLLTSRYQKRHASLTQGPGTPAGTLGALRDASDEATGTFSGIVATY